MTDARRGGGRLPTFFLATFGVAWGSWIAAASIPARGASGASALSWLRGPIFFLGVFAPGIVALTLTARTDGRAGLRLLLGQIGRWRVSAAWYLFATGYLLAIKLAAALIARLASGGWPRFGETPWPLIALAITVSTWVQAGEELGWRGYALPRLASHMGLGSASVVLGVIWAAWHLPLFFAPESDTYGQSFPLYVLQVTALSVAMAWVYSRTGGSLLLVMLMHAAVNNTAVVVPAAVPGASNPLTLSGSMVGWLTAGLLWATAACLFLSMRAADASACRTARIP